MNASGAEPLTARPAAGTPRHPSHRADVHRGPVGSELAGTLMIARHILRRDRVRLCVWAIALTAFVLYFSVALRTVFDPEALAARAAVMRTPSGIVMGGPGYGLDHYTPMVAVANEGITWIVAALGIMSLLHVVRHTRAEEDAGRAELMGAGAVGRHAPALATLLVLTAQLLVITVLGALATLAGGDDASFLDGLGMMGGSTLAALVIGAVALLASEVAATSRTATGLALAGLALLFAVRAAGDLIHREGSLLSWFSPFAWPQQMRPFVDLRWWPALLSVAAVLVLLAVAAGLSRRRDLGRGLVADRAGRSQATSWLRSPLALAWRQQRGMLLWSCLGLGLLWLATGTMMSTLADMGRDLVSQTPALAGMLGSDSSAFTGQFLDLILLFAALCAAAYGIVASGQHCRAEETSGRLEAVLAAPVSRRRWLTAQLLVALTGTAVLLVVSVAALAAGALAVGVDDPDVGRYGAALLAHLPATLVFAALSAALFAWVPRGGGLAWMLIAVVFGIAMFGEMLDLPDWVQGISPFHWVPDSFTEDTDPAGPLMLLAVDAVLSALALVGIGRRAIDGGL
ncbi:hypothetical protein DEO23_00440 [Brachybacterium endophyticum]|uniref:Polyketide antibiotic transporter n=1 Tax=Brachybacterium endophyticum TaxID=2182385 RepID=A0A2U2RMR6_9MICO|nr:ABC transporter permease subunit [Brachybacterium endophyticum]PWH07169.1 hypothetical protein DEO23_00440 [Brachybacterium endophyticum]